MNCRLFQEKLHTILRNSEGKNENTNEYIQGRTQGFIGGGGQLGPI